MAVYLLHFERPIAHARHYLGYADDVDDRIARHRTGHGARLVAEFVANVIDFTIAKVWPKGDRKFERKLKNRHNTPRMCPVCRGIQNS